MAGDVGGTRCIAALLVCWGCAVAAEPLALGARAGVAVAPLGKVDGGVAMVVGAPDFDGGAGAVYTVVVGADGALARSGAPQVGAAGSALGTALVTCDLDGDGFLDVIAGAPGQSGPGTVSVTFHAQPAVSLTAPAAPNGQAAVVDFGTTLACLSWAGVDAPGWLLVGSRADGRPITIYRYDDDARALVRAGFLPTSQPACGNSVALLRGEDGTPYALLGCPEDNKVRYEPLDPDRGADELVEWTTTPISSGNSGYGHLVRAIGDFNGDGLQDFAVAAAGGTLVITSFQDQAGLYAGVPIADVSRFVDIAALGDINGDGFADVAVSGSGGPFGIGQSALAVVYGRAGGTGPPVSLAATGGGVDDYVSAGLGDVDGDGLGDYVVGSPSVGAIEVHHGASRGPLRPTSTITIATDGGLTEVVPVGDVDGDGFSDVLWLSSTGTHALSRGASTGLSGSFSAFKLSNTWIGVTDITAAAAGDIDGDGFADIAFGSPSESRLIIAHGSANLSPRMTVPQTPTGIIITEFGRTLASAGDLDGDGYGDLAVTGIVATNAGLKDVVFVYRGGPVALAQNHAWQLAPGSTGVRVAALSTAWPAPDSSSNRLLVGWRNELAMCSAGLANTLDVSWRKPVDVVDASASADIDGDGDGQGDVVTLGSGGVELSLDAAKAAPNWEHLPASLGSFAALTPGGDVAGVGHAALFGATTSSPAEYRVLSYDFSTAPVTLERSSADSDVRLLALGDVNGDGADDLGVAARNNGQLVLHVYLGGDQETERSFNLRQRLSGGEVRGQGYVAVTSAASELVVFEGVVRDELGTRAPLALEVQVTRMGHPWEEATSHTSPPSLERGLVEIGLDLPLGAWRWRARVVSPLGFEGRWRAFGRPERAAFTIVQPPDGGVTRPDGGTVTQPDDGGVTQPDAGPIDPADGGVSGPLAFGVSACGCGAGAEPALWGLLASLVLALRKKRRR